MTKPELLKARAKALRLHGLLAHWPEAVAEQASAKSWIEPLLDWEEQERARRTYGDSAFNWNYGDSAFN